MCSSNLSFANSHKGWIDAIELSYVLTFSENQVKIENKVYN